MQSGRIHHHVIQLVAAGILLRWASDFSLNLGLATAGLALLFAASSFAVWKRKPWALGVFVAANVGLLAWTLLWILIIGLPMSVLPMLLLSVANLASYSTVKEWTEEWDFERREAAYEREEALHPYEPLPPIEHPPLPADWKPNLEARAASKRNFERVKELRASDLPWKKLRRKVEPWEMQFLIAMGHYCMCENGGDFEGLCSYARCERDETLEEVIEAWKAVGAIGVARALEAARDKALELGWNRKRMELDALPGWKLNEVEKRFREFPQEDSDTLDLMLDRFWQEKASC